jgi:hypothetical protein
MGQTAPNGYIAAPIPEPRRRPFEKHSVFLNGRFVFDETSGRGHTMP